MSAILPRRLVQKTYTERNRYGQLFPAIRSLEQAFGLRFRRILSYGCSSGEECITLHEIFPDALVIGTDANPDMIRSARQACAQTNRIYIRPYKKFWNESDKFDLICCMSVLFEMPFQFIPKRDWQAMLADERRQSALETFAKGLEGKFSFNEFDAIIAGLDRRLRQGGLLIVHNANYRLMETSVGTKYEPILLPGRNLETMPKLTKNYAPIDQDDYTEVVFRKRVTGIRRYLPRYR